MKQFYKKRGFTLLELMIVVIIVGILASLALPRFIGAAKKAKEAEARNVLDVIRKAQFLYYAENGTYTTFQDPVSKLGLELEPSKYYDYYCGGGNPNFAYADAKADTGLTSYRIVADGTIYAR